MVDINVLEERVKNLDYKVTEGFQDMRDRFDTFTEEIKSGYVPKSEFEPIRRFVYGLISLILLTVGGAILAIVVQAKSAGQ